MLHLRRELISQHCDLDMLASFLSDADSQPGDPDEQEFTKLFRPVKGVVELSHYYLYEDNGNHKCKHRDQYNFLGLVECINKLLHNSSLQIK